MAKRQTEIEHYRSELDSLRKVLGNRIRELRKQLGWSQEEFADQAHVHRTFAGSLERGEKNVSFHALALISRCFGITLSELLAGIERGESLPVKLPKRKAGRGLNSNTALAELEALEKSVSTLRRIIVNDNTR